jgi:uncharacterized membrane protein
MASFTRRSQAWLARSVLAILAAIAVLSMPAAPVSAHKDHKAKQEAAQLEAQRAAAGGSAQTAPMAHNMAMPGHAAAMPGMEKADDPPQSFAARLLDWLGRFHPMLVHFPIAFIPAALFTAIVGRRRPGFAKPVQFLVVTAGVTAPFAMLSGWLSGGFELGLDDWMMQSHRWLGTGIGVGAFALGVFALKRPEQDRGSGMIVGLSILTAAILVQGWFGGALVHGIDHLNW